MLQQRSYQFVVPTTSSPSSLPVILNLEPPSLDHGGNGGGGWNKLLSTLTKQQQQRFYFDEEANLMLPQRPATSGSSASSSAASEQQQQQQQRRQQQQPTRPPSTTQPPSSSGPSGGGGIEQHLRLHGLGSTTSGSQRDRFRSENLFRRLAHDTDIKYSGVSSDRPNEERISRFRQDAAQGELDIAFVTNGVNLRVTFAPIAEWARAPTTTAAATGGVGAADDDQSSNPLQRSSPTSARNQPLSALQPSTISFERAEQLFTTPYMLQQSAIQQQQASQPTAQRFAFAGMQLMQPPALMMSQHHHQQQQQQQQQQYSMQIVQQQQQQQQQQQHMMFAQQQQPATLYTVPAALRLAAASTSSASSLQPNPMPIVVPAIHAPLMSIIPTSSAVGTTSGGTSLLRHPPQLERDSQGNIVRIRIRAHVVLNGVCCIFRGHINGAGEHIEGEGKLEFDEERAARME